jgi:hypothetical protein
MKRKILLSLGTIVVAMLLIFNVTMPGISNDSSLSLKSLVSIARADDEGGDVIKCKCTVFGRCRADGAGAICAQSQPGGNINCGDYDGNC